jgi:hypothetical protein
MLYGKETVPRPDQVKALTMQDEDKKQPLSDVARRALAEAEERRRVEAARKGKSNECPREVGGRDGPDPARYGDWEKGGIASDF